MKAIKIAGGFACGTLVALFILLFTLENPEIALYERTLEILMDREGLASIKEVIDCFPALKDIKSNMKRIAYLKRYMASVTSGPAPNVSKVESVQLKEYTQEIRQLRRSVKQELTHIITAESQGCALIKTPQVSNILIAK